NSLSDIDYLKIKVSNPQRNIAPIEIPITSIQDEKTSIVQYEGNVTFGFSGNWQVEIEALRAQAVNEDVVLDLIVKPKLTQLKTEITEYQFPSIDSAPLYPLFDGNNTIWVSDPAKPRLWKFTLDDQQFSSFEFEGLTTIVLAKDEEGKIWFTDTPNKKIGFLNPETEKIQTISLPTEAIAISVQSDFDNNIWVSLVDKNMLLKYEQDAGNFVEYAIPTVSASPFALTRDSLGNIWFTESQAGKIGIINPQTGKIREFTPDPLIEAPEALYFDKEGMLWIAAHTGHALVKFNPILETFERVPVPDKDALPFGMIEDRFGNIWFGQHAIDKIGVYDPQNDNLLEVPVPTQSSFVQFLTSDDKDNIWFVEQQGNKVGMIKITEVTNLGIVQSQNQKSEIKYVELVSPLISMGIIATSLFFVKSIKDKRRIDSLIQ
ncbi:MAG: virginiamycin B lyase family protein, partial [Nitrosopumilaceae archaeon]